MEYTDVDFRKYGIKSVSLISVGNLSPRLVITHSNGEEFSYKVKNLMDDILTEHIRRKFLIPQRKEKLKRLNEM